METMRSLFSTVFTIGNSCGELHKPRTLPHLVASHCDKDIKGQEKSIKPHSDIKTEVASDGVKAKALSTQRKM